MSDTRRTIFRADAVQRYAQRRAEAVLPRFVAPRTFLALWLLLGALVAAGFLTWLARVPEYVAGTAVVIDKHTSPTPNGHIALAAFFPSEYQSRLRVGQPLLLNLGQTDSQARPRISAIEPRISSPAAIQRRFGLASGVVPAVVQPSVVVLAPLDPLPGGLPADAYVGTHYRVDVEVGSRPVLALIPLVGRLFEE